MHLKSTTHHLYLAGKARLEAAKPPQGKRRLLVVEDHPDTRLGLEMCLQLFGYQAELAANQREALALAAGGGFDLLLTDLNLPDGSGWELLAALEAAGQRPPWAVSMSCTYDGAAITRSIAAGFDRHLNKPFDPAKLEELLAR